MNFKQFFGDVVLWMEKSNEMVKQCSIHSEEYWSWAFQSSGELCKKYGNHPLAIKQMSMLIDFLEDMRKG